MRPLCALLHGYPNNHLVWSDQLGALGEFADVLNLSLPGSESGEVTPDELSLSRLIRQTAQTIAASPHEKVILMGHDIGAFILAEVASLLGDRVLAQIFLAGMDFSLFRKRLLTSDQALRSWYVFLLQLPQFPEKLVPVFRRSLLKGIYRGSPDLSSEAPHGLSPVAIYRELGAGLRLPPKTRSAVPTLFLFGEDDLYIGAPKKTQIDEFYADARMDVFPGGHWFFRENSAPVNQRISSFLQEVGA